MNPAVPEYLPSTEPSPNKTRQRACASCARTKSKCVPRPILLGRCERCARLDRHCEPLPPRPRAKRKQGPPKNSGVSKDHVAVLEEKLDGLVNLLKSTQDPGISAKPILEQSHQTPSTTVTIQSLGGEDEEVAAWDDRLLYGGTMQQRFALPPEEFLQLQKPAPALISDRQANSYVSLNIDLGSEDPDILLSIFRSEKNAFFPFLALPYHVSAEELRRTRPEFFISIMAVTTRVTSQQKSISNDHLRNLSGRVFVDGERNLDILLAVLTYAAWCYQYFFNHIQFTALLSLARLLVADLKLNRPNIPGGPGPRLKALHVSKGSDSVGAAKSLDEHRALICFWYLNSIIGTFFHKVDPIPWSTHLENSYQILAASPDRENRWAATLTKIQQVTEKITQSPWHDKLPSAINAPPALYLHSFKQQLDDIEANFASDVNENVAILLAFKNAQICLYKVGLSKSPTLSNMSNHDFDRIHYLHNCLQAVKSFFDTYLSLPISKLHCLSVPIITHFTWSLGVLQLLATFQHPDWNLEWARSTISFTDILGTLSDKYAQAKATMGLDPHTPVGEDVFSHSARRTAWMKSYFENGGINPRLQDDQQYSNPSNIADLSLGNDIDLMDDEWLHDLMDLW